MEMVNSDRFMLARQRCRSHNMKAFDKQKHNYAGWRKGALINTIVLTVVTTILVGFLIYGIVHAGGLQRSFFFLHTNCDAAQRIDTGIHLLINACSAAILASSNFFMQVLNAPSRADVGEAHAGGGFLHIGVPSWRNAFGSLGWKTAAWLVLALSSIPINLMLNSAIFVTDRRESSYYLAIVADGFVHGDSYFAPGASLSPPGTVLIHERPSSYEGAGEEDFGEGYGTPTGSMEVGIRWAGNDSQYTLDFSSLDTRRNLSYAAINAAGWVRLHREDCVKEYITCQGLREYRSLAVVIDRKGSDWARNDVWDLNDVSSHMWDDEIPTDQSNSLWFSAQCAMLADYDAGKYGQQTKQYCRNTCWRALGAPDMYNTPPSGMPDWTINFFPDNHINTSLLLPSPWSSKDDEAILGLRTERGQLSVDYCLAESDAQQCGVVMSNLLLFIVVVFSFTKVVICVAIMSILRDPNRLVTLGDAIQSFIVTPDDMPVHGDGTLSKFKVTRDATGGAYIRVAGSAPMKYHSNFKRAHSVISWGTWAIGSLPLVVGIVLVATFISLVPVTIDSATLASLFSSDSHNVDRGITVRVIGWMILVVNAPQIVLSFWYLVYNQALTRLIIANEWALFSTKFQPLRVTNPRGQQVSTYFLELPYRYSIPLITSSITIHWLASRSIYIFVGEGSYFASSDAGYAESNPNLPKGATLHIRFSFATLLLVVFLLAVMAIVLVGLSFRKLPGFMPIVGTNSRAIAAACHVSPLSKPYEKRRESRPGAIHATRTVPNQSDSEIPLVDMRTSSSTATADIVASQHEEEGEDGDDDEEEYHGLDPGTARLTKISRGLLSWGIVRMPDEWYTGFSDTVPETAREAGYDLAPRGYTPAHMSFGTPADNVRPPKDGPWYVFR